jgi:F-box/leucine-rich repeat protein 10/11
VFGGNFIHSYSIPTQLRLRQIEIDTKVPQRFRFPFFDKLNWYVAEAYCSALRSLRAYRPKPLANPPERPIDLVLQGLLQMADFLQTQVDILENEGEDDKKRKGVHDRVPAEVKDPAGLVRELIWRVKRELGQREVQAAPAAPVSPAVPIIKKRKLAQKMIPPSQRTSRHEWSVTEEPQSSTTEAITITRDGIEVQAEKNVDTWKQTRRRQYEVNGKLVLEEQTLEFSESRTIVP